MARQEMNAKISGKKLKIRDNLEDLVVDEMQILNWTSEK
jgi:hypothetical protein